MTKVQRRIQLALFVLVFSLVGVRAALITVPDPLDGRSSLRGDSYSDINTLSAVRYFYDHGFFDSHFRPMHLYTTPDQKGNAIAYTHYPSLPDVLIGAWAKLVGSTDQRILRIFPILISMGFFFFIFFFLRTWLQDPNAAFLSACLIVTSNYFIGWADTLHKHTFEEVLKWGFVHLLLLYRQSRQNRLILWLCLLAVTAVNISFEPALFLSVATVGFSFAMEKGWRKILSPLNIALGLAFVSGFGLHFYLNSLHFGSLELATKDLYDAFLYRTNQCLNPQQCGLTWQNYLRFPLTILNRIERFYWLPGYAVMILSFFAFAKWRREMTSQRTIFWILLAASLSWYLAMNQHAWEHAFVGKQSGILWAWVTGVGWLEYRQRIQRDFARRSAGWMSWHVFFLLYVFVMALTQQIKPLYWNDGFSRLF